MISGILLYILLIKSAVFGLTPMKNVISKTGYSIYPVASGLNGTRQLIIDRSNGDIITIARGLKQIVCLWETGNFTGIFQQAVILDASTIDPPLNLSHGIGQRGNYIYASSDVNIWRWPYTPGSRKPINVSSSELVVTNMGAGGKGGAPQGHTTRTFVFGPDGYFYIGISSLNNVDLDSFRSRVRRFYFPTDTIPLIGNQTQTTGGLDFESMEVWADGLRNPLGLDFDSNNQLWESDNGPDDLIRPDLGDIHPDNPCEEINLLNGPSGTHYGYPYCFSVGNLTQPFGSDPQTLQQLAWPDFMNDSIHTDSWCSNVSNNRPPLQCIPAHSSPIMMRFLKDEDKCGTHSFSFPCSMKGDIFLTLHGSWNRPTPVGYSVVRLEFDKNTNLPKRKIETIFEQKDFEKICTSANQANFKCFRPAGIAFHEGVMYVSSGATGEIVRVVVGSELGAEQNTAKGIIHGWSSLLMIAFGIWWILM